MVFGYTFKMFVHDLFQYSEESIRTYYMMENEKKQPLKSASPWRIGVTMRNTSIVTLNISQQMHLKQLWQYFLPTLLDVCKKRLWKMLFPISK